MLKKLLLMLTIIIMFGSVSHAYTSEFESMLNALDIPRSNVNSYWLDEDIYNRYNLLVYGNPLIVCENQRWKESQNGNWTYGGGVYNGKGIRGEYWILGQNYAGKEVHNEIFPDDYNSNISPLDWNYVEINDAEESWMDVSKYQTEKQKEYMLTQNLTRNNITYDLTASSIGINKARAESFATWKTKGSIYTKKIDENKIYWGATFNVPPMSADAKVEAKLDFENGLKYNIKEDENSINIKISYGGIIKNMSEFVSKKDIKNLEAQLIIDGQSVETISKAEDTFIDGEYTLTVSKGNDSSIEISVKCVTIAETCFKEDMPLYDSKEEILVIKVGKEDDKVEVEIENRRFESGDKPKIVSIEIKRVTTNSYGRIEYVNLDIARKTNQEFICAGQVIYIKIKTLNDTKSVTLEIEGDRSITTLDELTKRFEWTEAKAKGINTRFYSLSELRNMYKMPLRLKLEEDAGGGVKYFSTIFVIPYETKQTLNSWETLREEDKNAFDIDKEKLFTRIENPYELVFKAGSEIGITTRKTKLDVFEAWNKIYNRDLTKYIK